MSPVEKQLLEKRGISGLVFVLAGFLFLGIALVLLLKSQQNTFPARPSSTWVPGTNQSLLPQDRINEIVRRFSAARELKVRSFDMLLRPPLVEIETETTLAQFMCSLQELLSGTGLLILSRGETDASSRLCLSLGQHEPEIFLKIRFASAPLRAEPNTPLDAKAILQGKKGRRPKIVLVLDDAGGEAALQWLFIELPVRLNFAVIPGLANSHRFARRAKAAGHEVLIHLPMQPMDAKKLQQDRFTLTPGMTARDAARILAEARRSVPGAVALNNHMGSLATADRNLMRLFMPELKKQGLLFLDSLTHASSVAGEEAFRAGMPLLRRDIFLDHVQERAYIENALHSLIKLAIAKGRAIGIGHVTCMETWQVLVDRLKSHAAAGVDFIGITEFE